MHFCGLINQKKRVYQLATNLSQLQITLKRSFAIQDNAIPSCRRHCEDGANWHMDSSEQPTALQNLKNGKTAILMCFINVAQKIYTCVLMQ